MGNQLNTKQMFSKIVAVLSLAVVATQAVSVDELDVKSIKEAVHKHEAKYKFSEAIMRHYTPECRTRCIFKNLQRYNWIRDEGAKRTIRAFILHARGKI